MMVRTKRHYIWFLFYESAYLWTYAKKRFFGSDLHLLMGSWLYLSLFCFSFWQEIFL